MTYKLHIAHDSGTGQPVIFLHGIASTSNTWQHVLPLMSELKVREIAIDLLGFGDSPNPDWLDYTLEDHAKAVALTIRKLKLEQPPIVVGHSMGSLIAAELAFSYPNLVKRLILCSLPIYQLTDYEESSVANFTGSQKLNNIYMKVFETLTAKKNLTQKGAKRLASIDKSTDLVLNDENWYAFTSSIENAVIQQKTYTQLSKMKLPIDIIYGRLDLVLISKYYSRLADINHNIQITTVTAGHGISPRYAKALSKLIAQGA